MDDASDDTLSEQWPLRESVQRRIREFIKRGNSSAWKQRWGAAAHWLAVVSCSYYPAGRQNQRVPLGSLAQAWNAESYARLSEVDTFSSELPCHEAAAWVVPDHRMCKAFGAESVEFRALLLQFFRRYRHLEVSRWMLQYRSSALHSLALQRHHICIPATCLCSSTPRAVLEQVLLQSFQELGLPLSILLRFSYKQAQYSITLKRRKPERCRASPPCSNSLVPKSQGMSFARNPVHREAVSEIGLLHPIADFTKVIDNLEAVGPISILIRVRTYASSDALGTHTIFRVAAKEGHLLACFGWPEVEGNRSSTSALGQVLFHGPSLASQPEKVHIIGITIDPRKHVTAFVDGHKVASIPASKLPLSSQMFLQFGSGRPEVFAPDILEVRVWHGIACTPSQFQNVDDLPAPDIHAHYAGSCPEVNSEPWSKFHRKFIAFITCGLDVGCDLPRPPYQLLVGFADEVTYDETLQYAAKSSSCPVGFTAAFTVVIIHALLDTQPDVISVDGMLKLAKSQISGSLSWLNPTFGLSRPIALLQELLRLSRLWFEAVLNIPATLPAGFQRILVDKGNSSNLIERQSPLKGLCVCIHHKSDDALARLRNAVETLATGEVIVPGVQLTVYLSSCGGAWYQSRSSESWYLGWLQLRFQAEIVCGLGGVTCSGAYYVLNVPSEFHPFPFTPELVASRLTAASKVLLNNSVIAVSLVEKTLYGISGVGKSSRNVLLSTLDAEPNDANLWALVRATPAVTGGSWNFKEAAMALSRIYHLFAADSPAGPWLSAENLDEHMKDAWVCGDAADLLCIPASWKRGTTFASDDVWLTRGNPGSNKGINNDSDDNNSVESNSFVAMSLGLFNTANGEEYDATPHSDSLGVPNCFPCDLVAPEEDFTLYLAPLDVIGPCRELYSNLLLDALETLQLASFQGPHVKVVEPFISNAVWRRFSQQDADAVVERISEEGSKASIYSFWNAETSCGLRHGSATKFGDMFDWPRLSAWLKAARGIKGGISWSEFLQETNKEIDVLATTSYHHIDSAQRVDCKDDDTSISLRFFNDDFQIKKRVCVRSQSGKHAGGFELRFIDLPHLSKAIRNAVTAARAEGRNWASVGLFFYWIESAERARLHPGRYGKLSTHNYYVSIWRGVRFAPTIAQRAMTIVKKLGLEGKPFLAAHWRRGDWFLGPHPRKLEQAELAEPSRFAAIIRAHLIEQNLRRVFLMTNAPATSADVKELQMHLRGISVVQAPVLRGQRRNLQQLCIEMAIASWANFFIGFGDGVMQGHASMPSLLVMQMRLHAQAWPIESNAFSFVQDFQTGLGL